MMKFTAQLENDDGEQFEVEFTANGYGTAQEYLNSEYPDASINWFISEDDE